MEERERESMLANVYIRPPLSTEMLYDLMEFIMDKAEEPVIVTRDFNRTMDKNLDRFLSGGPPPPVVHPAVPSSNFVGRQDWWMSGGGTQRKDSSPATQGHMPPCPG